MTIGDKSNFNLKLELISDNFGFIIIFIIGIQPNI